MKLEDLTQIDVLIRPASNKRNVDDGSYTGSITLVELVERDSTFTEDGKRVVVNFKIEVEDDNGETVDLYLAPNLSWSKRGNLIKTLEKLDALPAPGESIRLEELVDVPVQVFVENVEKDGETYSNIMSMKRFKKAVAKKPIMKKTTPESLDKARRMFDLNSTTDDGVDDLFTEDSTFTDDELADFFG